MIGAHALPLGLVEILEMQPLPVRAEGHDHGIFPVRDRTIDVASQDDSVVHLYRHVPVNSHAVTDVAQFTIVHGSSRTSDAVSLFVKQVHSALVEREREPLA